MLNGLRVYLYYCERVCVCAAHFCCCYRCILFETKNMHERATFLASAWKCSKSRHRNGQQTEQNNETRLWIISKTMNKTKPKPKHTVLCKTTTTKKSEPNWHRPSGQQPDAFWLRLKNCFLYLFDKVECVFGTKTISMPKSNCVYNSWTFFFRLSSLNGAKRQQQPQRQ